MAEPCLPNPLLSIIFQYCDIGVDFSSIDGPFADASRLAVDALNNELNERIKKIRSLILDLDIMEIILRQFDNASKINITNLKNLKTSNEFNRVINAINNHLLKFIKIDTKDKVLKGLELITLLFPTEEKILKWQKQP